MDLVAKLAELTGFLEPTAEASAADLRVVRLALAYAMLRGQKENTHALAPAGTPLSPPELRTELEQIAAEAALEANIQSDEPLETRVFRRELPVLTSQHPASVPSWAAGLHPDRTLGPFRGLAGRPSWFDFFRITRQVKVVGQPGAVVLFALPLRGPLRASASYHLARGSVWLASQPLAASAPAGSFTGLRIHSGMMHLSGPAIVAAGLIQLPANVTITLTLQLDPPAIATGTGFGPGGDAANSEANLPAEATFVFAPNRPAEVTATDASAVLYGVSVPLSRARTAPVYEPVLDRILVPFVASLTEFTITEARSRLFTVSGTAPIEGGAWALPVAIISPTALGTASGAGALVVQTRPGLRAKWLGLAGGLASLNDTFLMIEAGRLAVTAPNSSNRRATHTLALWIEGTGPRRSSIDLQYSDPFPVRYFSQQTGEETLILRGTAVAHLDRPLGADGTRLRIVLPGAALFLFLFDAAAGVFAELLTSPTAATSTEKPLALALSNALIKATPAGTLTLFGALDDATPPAMERGDLHLDFGIYLILPMLPDPYAANFDVPTAQGVPKAVARLDCRTSWTAPNTPDLSFSFLPLEGSPAGPLGLVARTVDVRRSAPVVFAPPGLRPIFREDADRIAALRSLFDETVDGTPEEIFLLDVSTRADQLGVCLGFASRPNEPASDIFPVQINGVDLVTQGRNARLFTAPQIQWEPVWTIQNPDVQPFPFPSPLHSSDDGGPACIGVNTIELVPIAPRPVLDQIVSLFNLDGGNRAAGALFTLPFGMKAMARLFLPEDRDTPGAFLNLNQPDFPIATAPLAGALQLQVTAYSLDSGPDVESPSLPGATIQLRNGDDGFGHAYSISVLGPSVDTIFNGEFAPKPDGRNPRVPVPRIDFSGYGTSMFSEWSDPKAKTAETSQVRFNVMVGRTAYEVVQVYSLMYPGAVRVVRTVTIQRTGGGAAFRRDSGWVKVSDGVFDFPLHSTHPERIVTHPGVVKGFFDVRHIRDTSQVYEREYPDGTKVKLAAVHFDAEVSISGVVKGGAGGRVTSVDQVGFVQLSPSHDPLTPVQYADLLADQGPLGGPVDCVIDIGGSGQQMRLSRVDVANTQTPGGQAAFAAAGRGSPVLPRDGQWSVVRNPASPGDGAQALDRDFGVPLVRVGPSDLEDANNVSPYQFADPAYIMQQDRAPADYALLWSTGTQRILFARPKIARDAKAITSDRAALLADCFGLMNSTAIFPPASTCLELAASYSLQTAGGGGLRLVLPNAEFPATLVAGGTLRDLANTVTTRSYVDYKNTLIKISLDSTNAPSWSYQQTGLAIVNESDGATVKTTQGDIKADSNTAPQFTLIGEKFDQAVFSQVTSIMPIFGTTDLGGRIPTNVPGSTAGITTPLDAAHEPAAGEEAVKAGIKIGIGIPEHIPLIIGETLAEGFIEIATNLKSFFSLEMVVPILVAFEFKGSVKFKYEWVALTRPQLPETSQSPESDFRLPAGSKETVQLAVGALASAGFKFEIPGVGPFQANFKVFFGLGFIHETGKPLKVAALFTAEGGVQTLADPLPPFAQAGLKVEGQGTVETEGGDQLLVLQGKIAFELVVAFIVDIEFSSKETRIAKIKL